MHDFMEEPRRKKTNTTPKTQFGMRPDTKMVAKRPWIARGEHPDCGGMGGVDARAPIVPTQ